jgi:hypothetical protein
MFGRLQYVLSADSYLLAVLGVPQVLPLRPAVSISPSVPQSPDKTKGFKVEKGLPDIMGHQERESREQNTHPVWQFVQENSERIPDHTRGLARKIANHQFSCRYSAWVVYWKVCMN